MNEIMHR